MTYLFFCLVSLGVRTTVDDFEDGVRHRWSLTVKEKGGMGVTTDRVNKTSPKYRWVEDDKYQ